MHASMHLAKARLSCCKPGSGRRGSWCLRQGCAVPGDRSTAAARLNSMLPHSAAARARLSSSGAPDKSSGKIAAVPSTKQLHRSSNRKTGSRGRHSAPSLPQATVALYQVPSSSTCTETRYAVLTKHPVASTPDPLPWPLLLPGMDAPGALVVEGAAPAALQRVIKNSASLMNKMLELAKQLLWQAPCTELQAFPRRLARTPELGRPSSLRMQANSQDCTLATL